MFNESVGRYNHVLSKTDIIMTFPVGEVQKVRLQKGPQESR